MTRAARQGYAPAQCNLAVCYLNGIGVETNPGQAVEWLEKAAGQELFPRALDILGDRCKYGDGIARDEARAVELYRRAAEQGYPVAMCDLGLCYELGAGMRQAEAVHWYAQGALAGHAPSQCNLGYCYLTGIGVEPDPETAVEWLEKAAGQGLPGLWAF